MRTDFSYETARNGAGMPIGATILADRPAIADGLRDDAEAAGLTVLHCCSFAEFADAGISALGDLVLIDCPVPNASATAQLSRLDLRVGKSGAQCIVSTGIAGLDAVFGCFSLSRAQILVDPCRSERVIAIGRALADMPNLRLRELGEDDRLMLLRLTEQVARIAQRVEGLSGQARGEGGGVFRLQSPARDWTGADEGYVIASGTSTLRLPDPALVRAIIRARQMRARFFDGELFADPAWDILLDLAAAEGEGRNVCVTSLCIAAGVPATTALRWIGQMVDSGLLVRVQDRSDRRRAFIALSDAAREKMARYFADLGMRAEVPVAAVA